jgi:ferric-dicitrate binding protein FerR (iron transport regulator)
MKKEELFDNYLNNTITPAELIEFEELMQDEEVGREFVAYTVEIRDYLAITEKLENQSLRKTTRSKVKKRKEKRKSLLPLLVALAVISLSAYLYLLPAKLRVESGTAYIVNGKERIVVDQDKIPEGVELFTESKFKCHYEDGTVLSFSPQSSFIIMSLSPKKIRLLKGAVFADVAKQKNGPFKIITEDGSIKVLGTKLTFSKSQNGPSSLVVSEGSVAISNLSGEELVKAGEAAVMLGGSKVFKGSAEDEQLLKWQCWSSIFRKDKDLRLYVNFEKGIENLAVHKFDYPLVLKTGALVKGRFKSQQTLRNGIIELKGSQQFRMGKEMTIFTWVNVDEIGSNSPFLTQGDRSWRIQLGEKVHAAAHVGYGVSFADAPQDLDLQKWILITAVFNAGSATLYVNSQAITTVLEEAYNPNNTIMIGGNSQEIERIFKGRIGEAALIERALTSEEISMIYESGKP